MPQFNVPEIDTRTKAEKVADGLLARVNQLEETLINFHQSDFRVIWNNDDEEITPEAIFERIGTNSVAYLTKAYGLIQYLLTNGVQMAPEQYTPPRTYTANQDGTITFDEE